MWIRICLALALTLGSATGEDYGELMNRFLEATPIHPQLKTPDVWAPESNIRSKLTTNEYYPPNSFRSQPDCSETKKDLKLGDYGTISSPNYPRNYPGRKSCEWILEGPRGSKIQAVILDSITQPYSLMYSDYIMISRTGNFSYVDRLAGDMSEKTPIVITSNENKMGIRFRSNTLFNFRGFKMQYLVVPDEHDKRFGSSETPVFDGVCGQSYSDFPPPETVSDGFPVGSPVESPAPSSGSGSGSASGSGSSNLPHAPVAYPIIKPNKKTAPVYTVGGIDILKYAYPWMVALLIDGKHFCGGSLIDDQHVLTAAHCTYRTSQVSMMLGSYKINAVRAGEEDGRMVFNVSRRNVFQHPEYNPNTHAYDISIIRLPQRIQFNDRIKPVCLPNRHYVGRTFTDELTYVSGWGQPKDSATRAAPYLKEAEVRVVTNNECRVAFRGVVNGNLICTSTREEASPCKGDSGGPLMIKQDSGVGPYYTQIGIVSFGPTTCESGLPMGYTRLTAFLDFINEVTGKKL